MSVVSCVAKVPSRLKEHLPCLPHVLLQMQGLQRPRLKKRFWFGEPKVVCVPPKMGKRGNSDPGAGKQKASRKGSSNDVEADAQAARAAAAAQSIPWWPQALELLEKILGDTGASEYFLKKYDSIDHRREFALKIKTEFPLLGEERFSPGSFTPGLQTLQAWQCCYHIQGGNKGLIANENFTTLVQIILLEGFKSDAATVPGTEYLVIQPLIPVYFDTVWETPELEPNTFGAHSVGFVKGWSRCLALTTALHIILELDLVQYYRDHMPSQFRSFCILKAMVPANASSEVERIASNRGRLAPSMLFPSGVGGCRICVQGAITAVGSGPRLFCSWLSLKHVLSLLVAAPILNPCCIDTFSVWGWVFEDLGLRPETNANSHDARHLPPQFVGRRALIFAARLFSQDMTIASVMTRAPPNAFNTYHQLQRRLKHGESVEGIVKAYENPRSVKSVLGMGPAESQAVVNLVHFLPKPAKEILARAAVEFGMRKGVLSHAALGCQHMRPGHSPDLPLAEWKDRMTYTQSSIVLCCQRMVAEFSATIAAMRKTNGIQEVQRMSKLCRAWEIVIAEVRSKLASDQFAKAKDTLQQGFMDGCFDDYLLQIIEECPALINLKEIPQIKAVLDQHADDIEKAPR